MFLFSICCSVCSPNYIDPKEVIVGLKLDYKDFKSLLPLDDLRKVVQKYLLDPELADFGRYLQVQDFLTIFRGLIKLRSVQQLIAYLEDQGVVDDGNGEALRLGLRIQKQLNKFSNGIRGKGVSSLFGATEGIQMFLNELLALIPTHEISRMRQEKAMTSESYNIWIILVSMINQNEVKRYFQVLKIYKVE